MPQVELVHPYASKHSPTTTNAPQPSNHDDHVTNGISSHESDIVAIKQNGVAKSPSPQQSVVNGVAPSQQDSIGTRKRKLSEIETPERASKTKTVSPPWKKIAADGPTALKIDGRRVSARANPGLVISTDSTPETPTIVKKEKPPSPPWKSIGVDGPTARIVDGRRVSLRAAAATEVHSSPKSSTKRVSPPWKNVKAEGPSAKFVNGRRVSSRASGTSPAFDGASLQHGPEGRRSSPPWKNIAADGPTSVLVDGRRKSTRTSMAEEAMPPRRKGGRLGKSSKASKSGAHKDTKAKTSQRNHQSLRTMTKTPKSPIDRRSRSSALADTYVTSKIEHTHRQSSGRALRGSGPAQKEPASFAKIRLRVRGPAMLHQHPTHFARTKTHESLADWLKQDDPLEGETQIYSEDAAQREAAMRLTIVRAAQDNGVLSDARCTRFALRPSPEPLKKYGHHDHLVNHAVYFAFLRRKEMQRHMQDAAKVAKQVEHAVATNPRWAFLREAKSKEQLWEEQFGQQKRRYLQLMKDLTSSWALVRQEVDRIKFAQWEKEQDALGIKHLDEMLDHSKFVLDQQFRESSTDITSFNGSRRESVIFDDSENQSDGDSSITSDEEDEDDENLSDSSEDDKEEAGDLIDDDTGLTQDELRQKYASVLEQHHDLDDTDESDAENDSVAEDDDKNEDDSELHELQDHISDQDSQTVRSRNTSISEPLSMPEQERDQYESVQLDEVDSDLLDASDESTDMSSNMGDTESEDEVASSSEDEAGLTGLAGFFFSRDELLEAKKNADREVSATQDRDLANDSGEIVEGNIQDAHAEEPDLTVAEVSSEKGSDINFSAASTTWQDNDAAVSTPTTSMIPETPKRNRIDVSPLLRGTLREYQHEGVDWLAQLYSGGRNGILADEMGLGKTIQTIALLAHLATHHGVWGPHLVVVPTSVMLNWEMEFKKWCPSFKILTYYGDINERKRKRRGWNNDDMWNVCITSYNIILQDQQVFKRRGWHYLVLDEAHNIKNFQSQRWQTLLTFRTHSRLLLTGTPLQNNLQELWSLLYFLMPAGVDGEGFADLEKFLNTMKRPADQILDQGRQELDPEAQARVTKLHEILRPYLLRRLKADVEKQMPSKYEHVVYCRLSKRQRQLYDEFMGRADTKRTLASGNYMSIINCLMSLRKVCNHPDLFETRQIVTSFAMSRSAVASFEIKDLIIRRNLLRKETFDINHSGLVPVQYESRQRRHVARLMNLEASRQLESIASREEHRLQTLEKQRATGVQAVISDIMIEVQKNILADLRRQASHTAKAAARRPIYGVDLLDIVKLPVRWDPPRPNRKRSEYTHGSWFLDKCTRLEGLFPTVQQISSQSHQLITKFSCITPAVVAEDVLQRTLMSSARVLIEELQETVSGVDPYHEPRIRQSIAFPDKRLLQFDCGKLQALDKLLRDLQAGGHRCLIFTQMTRVLDILEQFLNIHGHRYLRLDGSTKVEQRQILTDRFNQDTRILAFILSSRSGGLGINLTGADTVIFYDLDWNPAMDKQCQDRCHRIGQTRDVHIYRFVSEYTIEANILRKSNQKRLLDDVIIQRGDFTTDMFERVTYRDALDDMIAAEDSRNGTDANASAALDKFLGNIAEMGNVLDNVEDKEDAAAAKRAQKEAVLGDGVDFDENTAAAQASALAANPNAALDAAVDEAQQHGDADELPHVDEYMVRFMMEEMKWDPIRLATKATAGKRRSKKAADWRRKR